MIGGTAQTPGKINPDQLSNANAQSSPAYLASSTKIESLLAFIYPAGPAKTLNFVLRAMRGPSCNYLSNMIDSFNSIISTSKLLLLLVLSCLLNYLKVLLAINSS